MLNNTGTRQTFLSLFYTILGQSKNRYLLALGITCSQEDKPVNQLNSLLIKTRNVFIKTLFKSLILLCPSIQRYYIINSAKS